MSIPPPPDAPPLFVENPRSTPLLEETESGQQQQQQHRDVESSTQFQSFDDVSLLTTAGNGCCGFGESHCSQHGSWLYRWWTECAWPGLGLFGESYLLFSIGILKPLWQELYPTCYSYEVCHPRLLRSLTYSVVLGVITGMLLVGYLANSIGRRRGSLLTATLMSGGAIGLTVIAWGSRHLNNNPRQVFQYMSVLLFVFGIGVGGEYPLSASSASERAMEELRKRRQQEEEERELIAANANATASTNEPPQPVKESLDNRGQRIQLVFTMQGTGIFVNCIIMAALLLLTGQSGNVYNNYDLQLVWRITYALGAATLALVLISRIMFLSESHVWEQDRQDRFQEEQQQKSTLPSTTTFGVVDANVDTNSVSSASIFVAMKDDAPLEKQPRKPLSPFALLLHHYGVRLLGTSLCWLLWDVAFYGNKLFQSAFLLALTGANNTTLFQFCLAAALNAGVALMGYVGAAMLVDRVGRQALQTGGLFITGALFVSCGIFHARLQSSSGTSWLVVLYLGSSFFGQLGPNCTTFLIPAEVFPTALRTTCHGISAASGKLGALLAAVLFGYLREVDLFLLSGICCFAACAVSVYTLPESKGLDLYELDKKWHLTLQGKEHEYVGPASAPQYLSFYERSKQSSY